ncbi:MAG: hypothetical protein KVP17_002622, partial [Porospora cf. gigantea B]|uniref:uncharacterized protein n=1 Tax=Porospora cf. gigantea B TaxID=2853592 RepID=UPI003571C876
MPCLLRLQVTVGSKQLEAVVDTGAWPSIISPTARETLELELSADTMRLRGLGSTTAYLTKPVNLHVAGHSLDTRFCVIPDFPFECCIGLRDMLQVPTLHETFLKNFTTERCQIVGMATIDDSNVGNDPDSTDDELTAFEPTFKLLCSPTLPESVYQRVWTAFKERKRAWLRPQFGGFKGPPAHIQVIDRPHRAKRRTLSPRLKAELDAQLDNMLLTGVAEPSKSPWSSPVQMTMKKDKTWRVAIDYREVNKRIKSDTYPLPLMEEILRETAGHKHYIGLDLQWGFWNMPLEEESREVTAFTTHRGLFQFRVLPFGLKTAPAEFQRCVDSVFGHLYSEGVKCYVDDIIICGDDYDEVLSKLDEVLRLAEDYGLHFKIGKSHVLPDELPLLGHLVCIDGYRPHPDRIQGLKNQRPPKGKTELRSFLSAASYVRDFVPRFSDLTSTFRPLLKKDHVWKWSSRHDEAYNILLQALSDMIYLRGPLGEGPFVLVTDASLYAVGAALLQQQEQELRLMGFYSKGLSPTEQRWDTREREAYAIKWALERTRDMIKGHRVYVFTDHSSLQWAADAPQSKIQRWMWYIAQFDLSIHHIPGPENPMADWLSRSNCFSTEHDEVIEEVCVPLFTAVASELTLQLPSEVALKDAYETAPAGELRLCTRGDDGLYYGVKSRKLYIPPRYRNAVVFWFHAGPYAGHRGVNATARKLQKYVWWPRLHQEVRTFIDTCLPCARNRPATRSAVTSVLQRPTAFELISLDYVGPRIVGDRKWYYLVVIDHCTRYVVTAATADATGEFAIRALNSLWLPVFFAPRAVLCDNQTTFTGAEFTAYVTQTLMSHLVFSSPYYPAGNGINESCHRAIEHSIACELQT